MINPSSKSGLLAPLLLCALLAPLLLCAPLAHAAGWPALDKPAPHGGGEKDAAFVASIERYVFLSPIPGAAQNAERWFEHLTKSRQVPIENVTLLRDEKVTSTRLRRFAEAAAKAVKPGGTLWFVFVGHGAPSKDGKGGLLVGVDAQQDADGLYDRSVLQSELMAILKKSPAKRIVAIIDACFSGRSPTGKALVPGLQPLVVIQEPEPVKEDKELLVFTAAKQDEFAGPLPGSDRPAFSYLALGALRGWADADGNGEVTAGEMRDYVAKALRALVKDRNQTPTLAGNATMGLGKAWDKGPDLAAMAILASQGTGLSPTAFARDGAVPASVFVKVTPAELGDAVQGGVARCLGKVGVAAADKPDGVTAELRVRMNLTSPREVIPGSGMYMTLSTMTVSLHKLPAGVMIASAQEKGKGAGGDVVQAREIAVQRLMAAPIDRALDKLFKTAGWKVPACAEEKPAE